MKTCLLALLVLWTLGSSLVGQSCGCTIEEVANNTVEPCMDTLGTVVNVSSVSEFYNAINTASTTGGNMTILFADGTYPLASTSQYPYITASNLIIRSASGNRDAVILTGQGMQDVAPGTEIGLSLQGDNVTIADLTIRDVGNHAISTITDGHLIHNVKIQNTFEQMIKGNSVGDGPDNCIVQCCLMEYTAGIGPQWYIGGLDIHGGNDWIVRDNIFRDIASPADRLAEHAVHFWDESGDNIVERNVIVGCDRGIGFGLGSSPNTGGIIRNNMIVNDGSDPFHDVGIGLETSPDTKVHNNTVHIAYPNAIEYRFEATSGVIISNNITNRNIQSRNGGSANVTNNITNGQTSWYVDAVAGDLRLASEVSSVIDQGLDLGVLVPDDIDQTTRPQGDAFDLGAHEWVVAPIDNDMDGFTADEDCDDGDPAINPDAEETPNNDVDENCDDIILIIDEDMDGFNSDEDCDDEDPAINPDAEEIPNNGIDEDCDGEDLSTSTEDKNYKNLTIYPVPTYDKLYVSGIDISAFRSLKIYDLFGNEITSSTNGKMIDLQRLPASIYLLEIKLKDASGSKFFKVIKL